MEQEYRGAGHLGRNRDQEKDRCRHRFRNYAFTVFGIVLSAGHGVGSLWCEQPPYGTRSFVHALRGQRK
jgi:hypothetical protein